MNIGNALLQGNDVTIKAVATAAANSTTFAPVSAVLNNTSLGFLVNGPASVNTSTATSGVTIGNSANSGSAQIKATGNLDINSTATATTTSDLTGISGLAYGESNSTATAKIAGSAVLNAAGAVTLNAASNNSLSVSEKTTQQAQGVIAVAFGNATSKSSTQVDGSVTGGSVQIGATNQNSFSTSASATDYNTQSGNGGGAGIDVGLL